MLTYNRQETLRQQQSMLRRQRHLLRWYKDGGADKDLMPVLLEEVGVPPVLRRAKVSDLSEKWQEGIEKWADAIKAGDFAQPNLFFRGGRTAGKSYASAAVLRKMILRNKVVGWRSWNTFVQGGYDRIRMSNVTGDEYADAVIAEAEERWLVRDVIQVLVIDEIDLLNTPEFMLPEMLQLIKHRTDYGLMTVMNGRDNSGQPTQAAEKFVAYRDETSLVLRAR